jgi:hypothetical protein
MKRSLLAHVRLACFALALAACGSHNAASHDGGSGGSPDLAGPGDLALPPLPPGAITIGIGPILIDARQETVQCITKRLPNTTDLDVVRIHTTLKPGSHHLILYLSQDTVEQPSPYKCSSFAGIQRGEQPVFIAESPESNLSLPSAAAYHIPAGQMVRIEAHYLNTTSAPIMGQGIVDLAPGTTGQSYQPVGLMFCGSVIPLLNPGLPPDEKTTLPVGYYGGSGSVDLTKLNVFAFTSHQHHFGTDVKVWKGTSANPTATQLYDNTSWDNPPLQSYGDGNLLTFAAGEGIGWQCSYDTTGATGAVDFGESAATNEMCFIWAYYYPYVGRFISEKDCWQ